MTKAPVRRLWMIGGSFVAVPMLLFGTVQTVVQLAHEEETVHRSFALDPEVGTLEVRGVDSLRLIGTDADRVNMTADVSHGLRRTGLSWRTEGDRLVIRSTCPLFLSSFCNVSMTLEVPDGLDLQVRGDGTITADNLNGNADLGTNSGRIEVSRIDGNLRLHSDSGRVTATGLRSQIVDASSDSGRVELFFDGPPDRVLADSDSGSVEVVVPRGEVYAVDYDTDSGSEDITVDQSDTADRFISATTDSGDVTVRYATA